MKKTSSFFVRLFGMEEQSEWLKSDKVDVFITAVFPTITSIVCAIISSGSVHWDFFPNLLREPWCINALHLLVIACTLLVIYRNQRSILVTTEKIPRLKIFIRKKCNLRDQSDESVEAALKVTRTTVSQFNKAWIILWVFLFIYYCGNLSFSILESLYENQTNSSCFLDKGLELKLQFFFNTTFDYLSSTALFAMFVILNSVTVSVHERKHGRHGLVTAMFFMVTFGCAILLPSYFAYALTGWACIRLQIFVSMLLGVYSALAFTLTLGKLNNNLQIPRVLFYGLYLYALIQVLQFLILPQTKLVCMPENCHDDILMVKDSSSVIVHVINECVYNCDIVKDVQLFLRFFDILFNLITFFGKIFLSLIMLWIVYDSKFIYFVLQQSQIITELPYKMDVFKTYMKCESE